MENNKLTISIGIPAYNEQANIKALLLCLLEQKTDNCQLKEIIIVSDGSNDNTISEINSIKDQRITVLEHTDRKGAALRQNEILDKFDSDILVLLNADVLPKDKNLLSRISSCFDQDQSLGLISSRIEPLPPRTFIEKVLVSSVKMKDSIAAEWNHGNNYLTCHGPARAFSKKFAKSFYWPQAVSEDAFSYFTCIEKGYKYAYLPDSVILYKCPDNLRDHLRQSLRFANGSQALSQFFDPAFIKQSHAIPFRILLKNIVKYFFEHPILFISYAFINLVVIFKPNKQKYLSSTWDIAISSKTLT